MQMKAQKTTTVWSLADYKKAPSNTLIIDKSIRYIYMPLSELMKELTEKFENNNDCYIKKLTKESQKCMHITPLLRMNPSHHFMDRHGIKAYH